MWGAAPILFWCVRCSGTLVWARPAAATPAGAGPAASPPPTSRSLLGGGGRPLGSGGAKGRSCGSLAGGGAEGGGGGAAPPPPRPIGRRPAFCCPWRAPPGYTRAVGVAGGRGRRARSGRPPTGQCGRGGGGGNPPPCFAPPSSQGRPLIRPLRLRRPGCRRSAVGRQQAGRVGACLGRGAPAPRMQHPLRGGGWGRRFFGLPPSALGPEWEGGGEWGGPSGPLAPPPDGWGGGGGMAVPAPGASHRLGGCTLPPLPST